MVHAYWGTILSVDDSVGRLLARLEATRQLDNTIVVFMGDNGLLEGEHGMVDKRTAHEPSMRIPLFVRYPALARGKVIPQQALTIDVAPSLLELCGAKPLAKIHGKSWVKLLRGGDPGLAERVVLRIQLREAIPLHAERARDSHRRVEIHSLPPRRRLAGQAHGGALRRAERSRRAPQPDQRSEVRGNAFRAEGGTCPLDERVGPPPENDRMPIDEGIKKELPDQKLR